MGLFSWLKDSVETVERYRRLEEQRDFLEHCFDTLNEGFEVANMLYFLTEKEILKGLQPDDCLDITKKQYYIDLLLEYDLYDEYITWVKELEEEDDEDYDEEID